MKTQGKTLLAALGLAGMGAAQTSVTIDPAELAELNAAVPTCAISCIQEYASALGCSTTFDQASDTCICQNGQTLKTTAAECLDAVCSSDELSGKWTDFFCAGS